jgi:hypothetical protein
MYYYLKYYKHGTSSQEHMHKNQHLYIVWYNDLPICPL